MEAIMAEHVKVNAKLRKAKDEYRIVRSQYTNAEKKLESTMDEFEKNVIRVDVSNQMIRKQMDSIRLSIKAKHDRWRKVSDKLIQIYHECENVRDEFMRVSDEFIKDKVKYEESKTKCGKIIDDYRKTSANLIEFDGNVDALYEIVGGKTFAEYCKTEEKIYYTSINYEIVRLEHKTTIQKEFVRNRGNYGVDSIGLCNNESLKKEILYNETLIKQMMIMIGYCKILIASWKILPGHLKDITISLESAMDALKKIDINIEHIITMTNAFEEAIECMELDIENARTEENLKAAREERRLRIARACPSKAELLSATANIEKLYLTSKICDVMEILQNSSGRNVIEELLRHTQYDYIRDDIVEFYGWMDSQIPDIRSRFMKSCHGFIVQHGIEFFGWFVDYMIWDSKNDWFKSSKLTFKYFTSGLPLIKLVMYEFYMQYLSRTETNQELKDDLIEFCEQNDCYFHQITIDSLKKWHEKTTQIRSINELNN